MDVIRKEPDTTKRKAQWDEVQKRFYEYVPAIRYGDISGSAPCRHPSRGSTKA